MNPPQTLLESRIFRVERIQTVGRSGATLDRDVIRHPGAVAIVPVLDDGQLCLIRNVRPTVGKTLIEIPAGTLEVGEDPAKCAYRELIEETGYRAATIRPLIELYTSPGIMDERMYVFVATDLTPGEMALEDGEEIDVFTAPLEEVLAMIRRGEVEDGKTVAAVMLYASEVAGEVASG